MKRSKSWIAVSNPVSVFLLTLFFSIFTSCAISDATDDLGPRLNVDRVNVEVIQTGRTVAGTKASFKVTANQDFDVNSLCEWVKPEQVKGSQGETLITLEVDPNDTGAPRLGDVAVLCGGLQRTITVTQTLQPDPDDGREAGYVYYTEDFSWMIPFNLSDQVNVQSDGNVVNIFSGGNEKYLREFNNRSFGNYDPAKTAIYFCAHYIKFGRNGLQTGLVLPPLKDMKSIHVSNMDLTFDVAPTISGAGNPDKVQFVVELRGPGTVNNGNDKISKPMKHTVTGEGQWTSLDVKLYGITNKTEIIIRSAQQDVSGYFRWYLDNIKLAKSAKEE